MANTLSHVTPKLLAQGLLALRQHAIMPRIVNRSYDSMAAQRGDAINVPLPSAITARSITPDTVINSNVDMSPTSAVVTLDWWYEAPFHLGDNDAKIAMEGVIPMQASEAIKALANGVDAYILGKHTGIYSYSGAAGTTPFASNLSVAASGRVLLNKQAAPVDDRRAVLNPDAEGNLLSVEDVLHFDKRGDQGGIVNGTIGRKMGIDWFMDQNIVGYTVGTAAITGWKTYGAVTAGNANVTVVVSASCDGTVKIGDMFVLSGQNYVVTEDVTATGTAAGTGVHIFKIAPKLVETVISGAALTMLTTSYTPNLLFHRDAFVWASRPLADIAGLGSAMQSATDPISGVALRLELSRQYKQTTFSYDILGGAGLIRAALATKLLG